jgi:hypothetical protein
MLESGDGTKTVYSQIRDSEGMVSSTYLDTIVLDTTPPIGTIIINGGDASTTSMTVILSLYYADSGSGVSEVRFSDDGVWDTEAWEAPTLTKSWTLTSGEDTKTVYYQIKDNVEQVSLTYSDTILLESPSPSASPSSSPSSVPTPTPSPIASPTPSPTSSSTPEPSPSSSQPVSPTPFTEEPSILVYIAFGIAIGVAVAVTVLVVFLWMRK